MGRSQKILSALFLAVFLTALPGLVSAKDWETLEGCRLKKESANDGDSFHVMHEGKEYIFRLYFVDTPETSNNYPDRVRDQGKYFHLKEKETLKLGRDGELFTRKFLSSGTFTVWTCWEDARGDSALPRFYALIDKDSSPLIEALASAGLVRIFGMPTRGEDTPLKTSPDRYIAKLKRLENDAQRDHLGGWKTTGDVDSKDGSGTETAGTGLLNVNTASLEDLEKLPGIGPVLARRIIEGRPYGNLEDLDRVQGIGASMTEKLGPLIRFKD